MRKSLHRIKMAPEGPGKKITRQGDATISIDYIWPPVELGIFRENSTKTWTNFKYKNLGT